MYWSSYPRRDSNANLRFRRPVGQTRKMLIVQGFSAENEPLVTIPRFPYCTMRTKTSILLMMAFAKMREKGA